ncbi:MAG: EGF domain-containing protein [Polyangiaceae bacterium]
MVEGKLKASLLLVTLALGCSADPAATDRKLDAYDAETTTAADGARQLAHQIVVKKADSASESALLAAVASLGASVIAGQPLLGELGYRRLRLPPGLTVEDAIHTLQGSGVVESAEPTYLLELSKQPDDPKLGSLWGMSKIAAPSAWDLSTGSASVRVAVLDTGVDLNHADLRGNLWLNPGETAGNGVDDDGNGLIDDVQGWDAVNEDNVPADDHGHGTHVAGTIGAVGNNALGVVGVNWTVRIVPVKVCSTVNCLTTDFAEGLLYAAKVGARVANASLGGYHAPLSYERAAIQSLANAGGVLVAAAGNDGVNTDASPHYPSSYDEPTLVSVAASQEDDSRASFSNYGVKTVHLAAPGANILSSVPGGGFSQASGTSMASPHVAGAAALLLALKPTTTAAEVKSALIASVDALPGFSGVVASGGRLNVDRLLRGETNCTGSNCGCGTGASSCAPSVTCADNPCDPHASCTDGSEGPECSCNPGYEGDGTTCSDVDECAAGTAGCDPNGSCENSDGSFSCSCNFGFQGDGKSCSDLDECAQGLDNCFPGSTCKNQAGGYVCDCGPAGCASVGEACAPALNACDVNATCTSVAGSYFCNCNSGYVGDGFFCVNVNECVAGLNDCSPHASCEDTPGSYECTCDSGWTGDGKSCTDADECALGTDQCDPNATCTNTVGSYTCSCNSGWTGDGKSCTDADECALGKYSCGPISHCVNLPGTYSCACNEGYEGDGTTCTDVDECALGSDSCDPNATCTNTVGSYGCSCNLGFVGDGFSCADVDECALGTAVCDPNASCQNTPGSYDCACNAGFQGNGKTCTDIDECALGSDDCDGHASCHNTPGSFSCSCNAGWLGDGKTCSDENECTAGTHQCSVNATCSNTSGGYDCTCNTGFEGDGKTCTDIDECTHGLNNCGVDANCENTPGAYHCSCKDGFEGNGKECQDVDECTTGKSTCNVHANCTNTHGGYMCACKAGYLGDGLSCDEIDECALGTDDCSPNADCTNTQGGFSCSCWSGYQGNGKTCTDVDECALGTDDCAPNASCSNEPGSFSCTCPAGYEGDGKTCTDVDECSKGSDDCDANAVCSNSPGSFSCACKPGFTGNGKTCTDIDECALGTDNCAPNATCSNEPGSFSCSCPAGYAGDGTVCTDVDECALGTDDCHADAVCTNLPGSFSCACKPGFSGNGTFCTGATHCTTTSCSPYASCTDTTTGFTCECNAGYSGDGFTCTDVDECALNLDQCDAHATCTNEPGGYSCSCNAPYTGSGTSCDLDECALNLDNCHADAVCTNTAAGFTCTCKAGYAGNGVSCTDVDECALGSDDCSANADCQNLVGSYACSCKVGYSGDGRTCLPPPTRATAIDASGDHTCALLDNGGVRCWGRNNFGQLGYGDTNDVMNSDDAPLVSTGGAVKQVAAGDGHSCALRTDGKVRCWGRNHYGQLGYGNTTDIGDDETPADAGDVNLGGTAIAIAAGGEHTCALLSGGTVRCWGLGIDGQLGYANTQNVGDDEVPASKPLVQLGGAAVAISAGRDHTCALRSDGKLLCWGRGEWAVLGYGNTNSVGDNEHPASAGPVSLPALATQISAGWYHTCARLSTGALRCWGYGATGQLGLASQLDVGDDEVPSAVPEIQLGTAAAAVSAGLFHTCALTAAGNVRCFGYGDSGRLGYANIDNIGDDEHPASAGDVQLGQKALDVKAGASHSCALLQDGSVRCWGNAEFGQLGSGGTSDIGDDETPLGLSPLKLSSLNECALGMAGCSPDATCTDQPVGYLCSCSAGYSGDGHTCDDDDECALGTHGCSPYALCDNTPGSYSCSCAPGFVGDGTQCEDVDECATQQAACDANASCANVAGGYLCNCNLGYAGNGQVCTPASTYVRSVSAGGSHSCALLSTGSVRCWGAGVHGQLGYGNANNIGDDEHPVSAGDVNVGAPVSQIVTGGQHTCALTTTGAVRCWGSSAYGQLGYGNVNDIGDDESPASAGDVNVGGVVVALAAGTHHTCALLGSGAVRCWGLGAAGRLGYANVSSIGDNESPASAGSIQLGEAAVGITAGDLHSCAVLASGGVRCWGFGLYGRLGYGNESSIGDDEVPATAGSVPLGGSALEVVAGGQHTCALMADQSVRCWGYGLFGSLGLGNKQNVGDDESPASVAAVDIGGAATDVFAGGDHSCAITSTGSLVCWGAPAAALGYGNGAIVGDDEHPAQAGAVSLGGAALSGSLGTNHSCALLSSQLRCFGDGSSGRLGYGNALTIGDDEVPSDVSFVNVLGY